MPISAPAQNEAYAYEASFVAKQNQEASAAQNKAYAYEASFVAKQNQEVNAAQNF